MVREGNTRMTRELNVSRFLEFKALNLFFMSLERLEVVNEGGINGDTIYSYLDKYKKQRLV